MINMIIDNTQPPQQFARIHWESRWNIMADKGNPCVTISQDGPRITMVNAMGVVNFDLRKPEDINSFCKQIEISINFLRRTLHEWETAS